MIWRNYRTNIIDYSVSSFIFSPFIAYIIVSPTDISFTKIMALLTFVGVFLIIIFRNATNPIIFPRYLLFYLFFIFYVFFADLILLERSFSLKFLVENKMLASFNILFIIENIKIEKKQFLPIIEIGKYVLLIAFVVILYQEAVDPTFLTRTAQLEHQYTEVGNSKNRLYSIYSWTGGRVFAAGLSFMPVLFLVIESLLRKNKMIIHWIIMGAIFALLSKQRWMMVLYSLSMILVYIYYKGRSMRLLKFFSIFPLILYLTYTAASFSGIDAEKIINERVLEKNKGKGQKSASTRILAFEAFNKLYWDNPIFGTGNIKYGMGGSGKQDYSLRRILKGRSSQIHVGYLSLFYLYGLVGGIFFLTYLFLLLKRLYSDAKRTHIWAPFLIFVGVAIGNLTDVNFQIFEAGLILALLANNYYNNTPVTSSKLV